MEKEKLDDGELISMVRMRGLKPSQVYKTDEIMGDEGFKAAIQNEVDYRIWKENQELNEELEKEVEQEEKRQIKEYEKMNSENELIPDGPDYGGNIDKKSESDHDQKEQKEKKRDSEENELIPGDDEPEDSGDSNDLIPE